MRGNLPHTSGGDSDDSVYEPLGFQGGRLSVPVNPMQFRSPTRNRQCLSFRSDGASLELHRGPRPPDSFPRGLAHLLPVSHGAGSFEQLVHNILKASRGFL